MRLKELKCKNCGATVKIEENQQQAKCEFCHTTFAVEDAYNDGYKFEKGRMQAQNEQIEKTMEHAKNFLENSPFSKLFAAHYIVTAVIGIIVFIIIAVIAFTTISSFNKEKPSRDNGIVDDMNNFMSDFDVRMFNNNLEMYKGTEYGSNVGRLLDEIITNNKKDTINQVTVDFKNHSTKDPEEIKEIKKELDDWTKYEVSFDYNDAGLIYLATIEE